MNKTKVIKKRSKAVAHNKGESNKKNKKIITNTSESEQGGFGWDDIVDTVKKIHHKLQEWKPVTKVLKAFPSLASASVDGVPVGSLAVAARDYLGYHDKPMQTEMSSVRDGMPSDMKKRIRRKM